jgi:hypothetical protein
MTADGSVNCKRGSSMYVGRNADGQIVTASVAIQFGCAEDELPDDDPPLVAFLNPPAPQFIAPQDLMAQFTVGDAAKIKAAVETNPQFWLLWSAMQAQKDPMIAMNARFLAGWNALVQILGQARMTQIAAALNLTIV